MLTHLGKNIKTCEGVGYAWVGSWRRRVRSLLTVGFVIYWLVGRFVAVACRQLMSTIRLASSVRRLPVSLIVGSVKEWWYNGRLYCIAWVWSSPGTSLTQSV